MSCKDFYLKIKEYCRQTQVLSSVESVLSWDQETYMPEQAIAHRADQISMIAKLVHERWTSVELRELLENCLNLNTGEIKLKGLSNQELRQLDLLYLDWKKKISLPNEFVADFSKIVSQATHVWQKAKSESNFSLFEPYLQQIIDFSRQRVAYIDPEKPVYDVLLDEYEPGLTTAKLNEILIPLKKECIQMLKKIKLSRIKPKTFNSKFDFSKQLSFSYDLLKKMKFDFSKGRLDISAHPFTIDIHPNDVRVTTRLSDTNLFESITSTIHEGGHGLYEQGLSTDNYGLGLSQSVSLGIHESQSRFWENHVGKSLSFWETYFPKLQSCFSAELNDVTGYDLFESVNQVNPGLIRVDADEISYCLHIIIRFECEMALFNKTISTTQLRDYWKSLYKDYLGVEPSNDAEGVLQDIHWATGAFGYFPTYVMGSIIAAQLFNKMTADFDDFDGCIESLDWKPINDWLDLNIFSYGRFFDSNNLVKNATSNFINVNDLITYLKSKYKVLYKVEL
jgi:carboxypeptidase Taq